VTKKLIARNASVAMQQKTGQAVGKYSALTTDQLHQETLKARETFFEMCVGAERYAVDVLLPYCEEIIERYKMQGVAAKNRPNEKPTVESYFKSIKLNYSTVRSWIHRKKLQTEMFRPKMFNNGNGGNTNEKIPSLTLLEYRLLGTASAGHDLANAIKHNGNVDAAIKEFEDYAPTPERIEEYIARPVMVASTEVKKLALQLCKLIDENDGMYAQDILALARELRTKLEPTAVPHVLGKATKHHDRKAQKKVSSLPEKTALPLPQPTNGVEQCAR
jgi:hypothetical protein